MDPLGWTLLSLSIQRPQSKGLQTNDQMQYMQGQTSQLHKEKQKKPKGGESVDTKYTSPCRASEGSVSCSRQALVDVVSKERPKSICRVYAIIDDQNNTFLITSKLAGELGATSQEEKYYLTTCSSEKEAKYGCHVIGVVLTSLNRTESELPTLIECNNIPCNKQEIPTSEMVRRFPQHSDIMNKTTYQGCLK